MHTFEAALRRFRAELSAALGLTLAACGPGVPAITTAAPMTDTDASTGSDVPTTSTSAGSTSPDGPGATSMATGGPSSDGVFTTSHASSTGAAPASSSDTGSSDTSSSDTSSSDTGSSDASSSDTGSSDASSSDTGSSEASTTGEGTCRPFTLPFEPEVGCFTPPDDVACAACDDFCVLLGIDTIVTEGLVGCGVNQLEYCVLEPPPPDAEGPCCYTFIATISCDGRPFLVAGVHRTAPVVTRDDWSLAARPDIGGLDPATRVALADAWTTDALAEHASIAAFARFVLHLLAVGAPPGLLRDAQQALADEIDHAARTFGLASAYAGRAVGPGPIDIRHLNALRFVAAMIG